ncbi:MAG: hypothetical protein FJW37_01635 [Acidobacteria bacterium]|nr:hypothetical protein [Acidobacteriota bacterium]
MTPAGEILREEIRRSGPIRFHHFMDVALYHPEHGYYRRDRFGRQGDFFTAAQLQPVYGRLIAAMVRRWRRRMGSPDDFQVLELGPGRQEMAAAFSEWNYLPVDLGATLPARIRGVVFANEFFDALPVEVVVCSGGELRELRVDFAGRFVWRAAGPPAPEVERYVREILGGLPEGQTVEVNLEALRWIERIASALEAGCLFTVDYGYTTRERIRYPGGTLMSYRRHMASEEVLQDPGERDLTAHVCFTALERRGQALGLRQDRFETLAAALLAAGEPDEFAGALAAESEAEKTRLRLQLKTLLYGMGETFRTLLLWKA